ncbi:hypothetical protein [Streptomyces resistomycificus]|uniref:hypothetical protein n=1 Tax=Streptomyces resistomycificus TaxID=67356 RepID=UPI0006923363|nr:hypothetical protein [Streptomyces resistomycificus]KUN92665.1 hypothetical protein AQJ84_32310 [Streptomyces resistomycificus]
MAARRARHRRAQLGVAADIAITAQRKALAARLEAAGHEMGGERRLLRGRVSVQDVLEYARQHFGLTSVAPEQAAAVLRTRYELRGGHRDLDTDAYAVTVRSGVESGLESGVEGVGHLGQAGKAGAAGQAEGTGELAG